MLLGGGGGGEYVPVKFIAPGFVPVGVKSTSAVRLPPGPETVMGILLLLDSAMVHTAATQ